MAAGPVFVVCSLDVGFTKYFPPPTFKLKIGFKVYGVSVKFLKP